MDPVSLSAVISDDLEVALLGELLPLRRRKPSLQEAQRRPSGARSTPCLRIRARIARIRERPPGGIARKPNMAGTPT